jgi:hypothetical protein
MDEVIVRKEGYQQVCVWPGCFVIPDGAGLLARPGYILQFEQFMKDEFNTRVQYLEEVKTFPDMKDGHPVGGTGNRRDLLFAVHDDDIGHFAIPRLKAGIRWIEDVLSEVNHSYHLYPVRLYKYCIWGDAKEKADQLATQI